MCSLTLLITFGCIVVENLGTAAELLVTQDVTSLLRPLPGDPCSRTVVQYIQAWQQNRRSIKVARHVEAMTGCNGTGGETSRLDDSCSPFVDLPVTPVKI